MKERIRLDDLNSIKFRKCCQIRMVHFLDCLRNIILLMNTRLQAVVYSIEKENLIRMQEVLNTCLLLAHFLCTINEKVYYGEPHSSYQDCVPFSL